MAYATLKKGSKGEEVKRLQTALLSLGYDLGRSGVDGVYGNATVAAVKEYQGDNGLKVDGIAGNATLAKLYYISPEERDGEVTKAFKSIVADIEEHPEFERLVDLLYE